MFATVQSTSMSALPTHSPRYHTTSHPSHICHCGGPEKETAARRKDHGGFVDRAWRTNAGSAFFLHITHIHKTWNDHVHQVPRQVYWSFQKSSRRGSYGTFCHLQHQFLDCCRRFVLEVVSLSLLLLHIVCVLLCKCVFFTCIFQMVLSEQSGSRLHQYIRFVKTETNRRPSWILPSRSLDCLRQLTTHP